MKPVFAIGTMSGTSLDGIDTVLAEIRPRGEGYRVEIASHIHRPFAATYGEAARNVADKNLLREAVFFGAAWAETAAREAARAAKKAGVPLSRVTVIGAHGQTLFHLPGIGITFQAADLSRLAARTGVTVVGNFRTADMALGGQGAPLAPHAHRLLFAEKKRAVAVQNLGGIGNVTLLKGDRVVLAFDTGPANIWIDTAVRWRTGGKLAYDHGGKIGRGGKPDLRLAAKLLSHPYFKKRPPKSAGWEEFGPAFLSRYRAALEKLSAADAVATVTYATAAATASAYKRFIFPRAKPDRIILAGGGAKNPLLVSFLRKELPESDIDVSSDHGVGVDRLEALCFALLAVETLRGRPGNEPRATGAEGPAVCGQIAFAASARIDRLRSLLLR